MMLPGCAGRGTRGTAPRPGTPWEQILAAGRKEGRVLMYGGAIGAANVRMVAKAFKAATGIDFDLLPITGAAAMTRTREEAKVGIAPDVFEATGGWLRQLSADKLLIPLHGQDLPVWREHPQVWNIHPGYKIDSWEFVLSRLRVRQGHLGINTHRLAARDYPVSWHDLATQPKYKGSMVLVDPSRSTSATAEFIIQGYVGKGMTPRDMWGIVNAQAPMLVSMPRANVASVAQGERAMTFPPIDETVMNLIEAGAPLKNIYFPNAPIFAETAEMGVVSAGAHPNAAMVFINWYLSKAGQTLLGSLLHQTSIRRDVASTVPVELKGEVVGGGPRGPIIVDRPLQTELIQEFLGTGAMKLLVNGQPPERFERRWQDFIAEWEAEHGGPQDKPMILDMG